MTTITVIVAEEDASSYYRLREPARVMSAAGHDVKLYSFQGVREETPVRDSEVFVMNRPVHPSMAGLVKTMVDRGKRVVVDLDDDFVNIVPEHVMYGRLDVQPMIEALKIATLVTATTPALADLVGFGHAQVIPNHVPERYLYAKPQLTHDGTWVGWFGGVGSHPNDLQESKGGVARALIRSKATLAFLGNTHELPWVKHNLGLPLDEPAQFSGYCPIHKLPDHITQFDIGIVPLEPSVFNQSKSWLKGLEFAACGVPFIASPTADYQKLHNLGAGLLAETRNEWSRHVQELVRDKEYRAAIAQKGRMVATGLTFEGNVGQWESAWLGTEAS